MIIRYELKLMFSMLIEILNTNWQSVRLFSLINFFELKKLKFCFNTTYSSSMLKKFSVFVSKRGNYVEKYFMNSVRKLNKSLKYILRLFAEVQMLFCIFYLYINNDDPKKRHQVTGNNDISRVFVYTLLSQIKKNRIRLIH